VKEHAARPNGSAADEVAKVRMGLGRAVLLAVPVKPDNVQRGAGSHRCGQEPASINQLPVDLGIRIGKGEPQATHHDSRTTLASGIVHDNDWPPVIKV
jgi:hypothetical protein